MKNRLKRNEPSAVQEGHVDEQMDYQYSLLSNLMSSLFELSLIGTEFDEKRSSRPKSFPEVNEVFGRCLL